MKPRHSHRRTRGQSLVEFALIVPVFFVILAGVFDFGRLIHTRMMLINASREGARVASIMISDTASIQAFAEDAAFAASGGALRADRGDTVDVCFLHTDLATNATPGTTCTNFTPVAGDSVRVTVNTTFAPILPGFPRFQVTDSVQMVIED